MPPQMQGAPLPQPPGLPAQQPRVQRTPGHFPQAAQADAMDDVVQYGRIGRAPNLGWRR